MKVLLSEQGLSLRPNNRFGGVSCRITSERAMDTLMAAPSSVLGSITSLSFSGLGHERITEWLSGQFVGLNELSVSGAGLSARGSAWSHGCNVIQMSMDHSDAFFSRIMGFESLRVLRLANNRLSNRGLSFLSGFENLEGLDLSGNEITSVATFPRLVSLKRLNLANNRISVTNIGNLRSMDSLETLNLSGNPLTTNIRSKEVGQLKLATAGLLNLSVANCGLVSVGFLSSISSLQKLVVSRNPRVRGLGQAIRQLSDLTSLEAAGLHLTEACAKQISARRSLVKLDLRRTTGALGVVENIEALSMLNTLRIDGVDTRGAARISGLNDLRRLTLNNGSMGNEGVAKLSQIKGITHLSLANQQLDDDVVLHLAGLSKLRSLTLSHNALRGAAIGELFGLRALTKLSLISNPLETRHWEGQPDRLRVLF